MQFPAVCGVLHGDAPAFWLFMGRIRDQCLHSVHFIRLFDACDAMVEAGDAMSSLEPMPS